jgi:CubicO group peptidase (beta-lactamase class C family)
MNRSASLVLATILLLSCAIYAGGQVTTSPELQHTIEQLDRAASAELAKDNLGSVTIGLISGANLVWAKSYGLADMEKKTPATKDSVYRIGSITKQFTALMLLQLVQDGKVHFSDPVEKYLPEVNKIQGRFPGAPPITLIQLATHTSGLDREPDDLPTYLKGAVSEWEKVLIAALPHTRYAYEPGTRYSYSNIGYAILGAALSRAAGQPYVEYVQQRILKPLGMDNTAFEPNDRIKPRISKGYVSEKGKVDAETAEREHQGRGYKVPNGAIYTTVEDLARFVAFEMGEGPAPVLKKESLDDNFKRVITANAGLESGYGVGFEVIRHGDVIAYGHSGAVAGYQAAAYFNRSAHTGVIILRNVTGGLFNGSKLLIEALENASAKAKPIMPEQAVIKVDPRVYDDYVGEYEVAMLGVITITREGDRLFGQPSGESKEELIPKSGAQFSVPSIGAEVVFVRDEKGKVTHIIIRHGGQEMQGKKILKGLKELLR